MSRRTVPVVLLAALVLVPARSLLAQAPAAAKVALRLNLEKGDTIRFRSSVTMVMSADMPGDGVEDATSMATRSECEMQLEYRVVDRDADQALTIDAEILRARASMKLPFLPSETEIDSSGAATDPGATIVAGMVGKTLRFVIDHDGKLTRVSGFDALLKELHESVESESANELPMAGVLRAHHRGRQQVSPAHGALPSGRTQTLR